MQKIKANNYAVASKELVAYSEDLEGVIPEEINFKDRKHYVVAMVKVIDKPGQPKNDVKVDIICQDKIRFERMVKNYQFHGYVKMILIHDPSQLEEQESNKIPSYIKTKTEAEIRKEVEAEMEATINKRVEEAIAQKMKSNEEVQTQKEEDKDKDKEKKLTVAKLKKMNGADLEALAKENELDLTGLDKVEDKRNAIITWFEETQKPSN